MDRNPAHVIKAGSQSSDDPRTFILSSDSPDRMGDIIHQDGWELTRFKQNPVALFGHDHGFPIGTWKNVGVHNGQLTGTLQFAKEGTSERIDEIRSLVDQGVLKATSVGFRVKEYEPIEKDDPWGAWNITKAELLETSIVAIPANQDALAIAKSLGVSEETKRLIFGRVKADQNRRAVSGDQRQRDYSDLLGETSDVVRARRALERRGML